MEKQRQDSAAQVRPSRQPESEPAFSQVVDARGCIRAHGDLTHRTAAQLRCTVEALRGSGLPALVLDLRGLKSVDDAALSSLLETRAAIEADGGRLTVLDPTDAAPAPRRTDPAGP